MGIIDDLKNTRWEDKSRAEIEAYRISMAAAKMAGGAAMVWGLKMFLLHELQKHAKDGLANRLFEHYLFYGIFDYTLTLADMRHMNSHALAPGPINIGRTSYTGSTNPAWTSACRQVKSTGTPRDYSGSVLWGWDNGAIGNYTVRYQGQIHPSGSSCEWQGTVNYYDEFDLDPRWNWSPLTPGGRSRGGERRTRIGYILNLGTDYTITSPVVNATQGESDTNITIGAPSGGSGGGSGDLP